MSTFWIHVFDMHFEYTAPTITFKMLDVELVFI
jgi:hypothetical protein